MNWKGVQADIRKQLLPSMVWNSAVNHARIRAMFRERDCCLTSLAPLSSPRPAIILGSGPTLDAIAPRLKDWSGAIFASPSQLNILRHHGARPDFVVCADNRDDVADQIQDWTDYSSILITEPDVSPKVLEAWEGRVLFYISGVEGEWGDMQHEAYPWIKATVQSQGCTVNGTLQIAEYLGYSPLILAGLDFAIIDGRNRATDYKHQGYKLDVVLPQPIRDAGAQTAEMELYYIMLLAAWKTKKYNLWQVTPHPGALLQELPQVDIPTLIAGADFSQYLSPEAIDYVVDCALYKKGIFVHPVVNGSAEIEYIGQSPPKEEREPPVPHIPKKGRRK